MHALQSVHTSMGRLLRMSHSLMQADARRHVAREGGGL
jgi:hypothetical protein